MAGSSELKMAIRKELTVESDPRMRNRPLGVNDYYVLPGSCSQVLEGWAKLKQMGTEGLPSEAAIKGAFCLAPGPEPRLVRANAAQLPAELRNTDSIYCA